MRACQRCDLYNRERKTCGTPGWNIYRDPENGEMISAGCFCNMPVKASCKKASCWAYQRTSGRRGWPKELNYDK